MNELSNLAPRPGARKDRKRFGRGPGSGHGKTAGRGQKGQNARTSKIRPGFEGGQTPLIRRIPIRGFNHFDPIRWSIINIVELDEFDAGTVVTPELLADRGIIRTARHPVKVLGDGDLSKKLTVRAHKFSKSALAKIAANGGTTEVLKVRRTEVPEVPGVTGG